MGTSITSGKTMRYAGYVVALVIGVAAVISGIASGAGGLAGAGVGWLVDSVILIVKGQSAKVQPSGPGVAIFAIFYDLPAWLWGLSVVILVVGGVVGYFIKH